MVGFNSQVVVGGLQPVCRHLLTKGKSYASYYNSVSSRNACK